MRKSGDVLASAFYEAICFFQRIRKFGWIGNDAEVYELIKRVHGTKQGKGPLAGYYADLRAIWQEID